MEKFIFTLFPSPKEFPDLLDFILAVNSTADFLRCWLLLLEFPAEEGDRMWLAT